MRRSFLSGALIIAIAMVVDSTPVLAIEANDAGPPGDEIVATPNLAMTGAPTRASPANAIGDNAETIASAGYPVAGLYTVDSDDTVIMGLDPASAIIMRAMDSNLIGAFLGAPSTNVTQVQDLERRWRLHSELTFVA